MDYLYLQSNTENIFFFLFLLPLLWLAMEPLWQKAASKEWTESSSSNNSIISLDAVAVFEKAVAASLEEPLQETLLCEVTLSLLTD
jgi:hypothetical protein